MWWWLLPKNCTPFYNKYTRWRAVAVPSCPVAALLLLPARCPFQGHTDRWGKVSLPNQARRRWHKFSVASNRKTNLILETRTLLSLSLSLSGGLNRRERRRFQFGCSTDCSSFLHMITQRPRRRPPGRTASMASILWERGKFVGVGTHVRRCPRFFVFPDAPHDNDHDWWSFVF